MHRARKRFGQHFLHDRNVIERILQAIDPQVGDPLIEIGPGRGALTLPLLERCGKLLAIELDRDLVPLLQREAADLGELRVINADILEFDIDDLGMGPCRLVGNLPYNISTPLLFHLLESADSIADMHFMLQKEVALRIVAEPGDNHYGRLSVMLQYHCDCTYLFEVEPRSFNPPPKVDSAVVRLLPSASPKAEIGDYARFAQVVQTAFGQRRKTIANSLKSLLTREQIASCDIDPGARAENLGLSDFASLSRSLDR